MALGLFEPVWSLQKGVRVASTTRYGGVSKGVYAELNFGYHVGDEQQYVRVNRKHFYQIIGHDRVQWLDQLHGADVCYVTEAQSPVPADATWTDVRGVVMAIMTADCVPVLLCDKGGTIAAAIHCGWRGTAAGVIEATLNALPAAASELTAWLGPGICGSCYEVGREVLECVGHEDFFSESDASDKWFFDLRAYVVRQLTELGVLNITESGMCTYLAGVRNFVRA
jgi:YfiH family protein